MVKKISFWIAVVAAALLGLGQNVYGGARRPFPTEDEVRRTINNGMTAADVVEHFGEPTVVERAQEKPGLAVMYYYPPLQWNTPRVKGYGGFQVFVENGKVFKWLPMTGLPAYVPE